MATSQLGDFIHQLRTTVQLGDEAVPTDGQLLGRFVDHQDEAALVALIRKHGPMVWGVCRRLLHPQDAEDAFQATFLVLVRKAASVLPRDMVANWLYGVARQSALKARAAIVRRKDREKQVTKMPEPAVEPRDLWTELRPLIDQELSSLPDKYRAVVVLCDLEARTRQEAARQLGLPQGTVASRLNRARAMLAKRLSRFGLPLSGGVLATLLSQKAASAAVPPTLVRSAITVARIVAAGQTVAGRLISAKAVALSEALMKTMMLTKAGIGLIAVVVIATAGVAGDALFHHTRVANAARLDAEPKSYNRAVPQGAETVTEKNSLALLKRHTKKAALDLTGSSDVIAVDLAKRIITGTELLGTGEPFWLFGDRWKLSIGPTTQIIIDGKKAQLEDLKRVVEAVGPGHFITVSGEWDFEVLKPRHSVQTGTAVCIDVKGPQEDGLVEAVDVGKRLITLPRFKVTGRHRLAADAQVLIDGKAAGLADLKPNMHISLLMSAVKNAPDVAVRASGPTVEGVVKTVNAEANTIGVSIPSIQVTAERVPLARDAKVFIDGKEGTLSDLKAGMRVTLQMCAEMDKSLVVAITTTRR